MKKVFLSKRIFLIALITFMLLTTSIVLGFLFTNVVVGMSTPTENLDTQNAVSLSLSNDDKSEPNNNVEPYVNVTYDENDNMVIVIEDKLDSLNFDKKTQSESFINADFLMVILGILGSLSLIMFAVLLINFRKTKKRKK